jgi:cytoskeletal protein RodZ
MSKPKDSIREFGQELINARKFKHISLEQISEETKISLRYLKAIEDGEWDVLPRPYMEVFLRAYAEAAGMNVPKVMKKYREMVRSELPVGEEPDHLTAREKVEIPGAPFPFIKFLGRIKVPIAIGAVLVLILILWIIFGSGNRQRTLTPPVDTSTRLDSSYQPGEEAAASGLQGEGEKTPASVSGNLTHTKLPETKEFTLSARARERCWLQATIDQNRVRDVYLYPGDQITLRAQQQIHLVVGNAGGLELSLAGQVLDSLGPSQKPVTIVIGSEGIISQRLGAWQVNFTGEMNSSLPDSSARP